MTPHDAPKPVVGRSDELAEVSRLVRDAVEGRFGAVVVEGDAGMGKTSLVAAACEAVGEDVLVLPGGCLPLTSVSVPLIGLRTAVRALPRAERPAFLSGAAATASTSLPVAFDEWLGEQLDARAVVLVVDDLQWADPATLDALMYVLAGPVERALAVLLTRRSGELGPAGGVDNWLGAATRLPGVGRMQLGPLSHDAVADLAATLVGGPAHTSLVDEVHERSGGNPYLASLLLRGLGPSARRLPPELPEQLRGAVERTAGGLSPTARRLCLGLAVWGLPADADQLRRVADIAAVEDVRAPVREGLAAKVLDVDAHGSVWFTHPLHAEVLQQTLLPDERRVLHAGMAADLEARHGREPSAVVADAIATHHHLAGDTARALRWALDAARAAGAAGDDDTRLRMLRRALVLGDQGLPPAERGLVLEQLREVAYHVGDWAVETEAVGSLIDLLDDDGGPGADEKEGLRLAELLVRRNYLFVNLTQGVTDGDTARALRLTQGSPGSDARRLALGAHADNLIWAGRTNEARPLVEAALRGDTPSVPPPGVDTGGSPFLRSWSVALYAGAALAENDEETERSRHLSGRAADLALAAGDQCMFVVAAIQEVDVWEGPFSASFVDRIVACHRRLQAAGGAPHYMAFLAPSAAAGLFITGRPQECAAWIRSVLGADHAAFAEVRARRWAALLAASQGRQAEAEAHLERATELAPQLATDPTVAWCWCRATLSVMAGDPEAAVEVALAGRSSRIPRGTGCEWLLPIAARGLADLAEAARDTGEDPAPVLRRLADVTARDPEVIADVTARDGTYGPVLDGLQALYEAECARARADVDRATAWTTAVRLLARTELAWDLAYARWRAGEALLAHGGGEERRAAAEHLREGHTLATRLGAQPVLDAIEALARSARIRLDPVEATADASGNGILTRREREVLAGVVAGRTYAEIADDLFVSEKTVSSHISNILRKTGTANRVELASWAARTEQRS